MTAEIQLPEPEDNGNGAPATPKIDAHQAGASEGYGEGAITILEGLEAVVIGRSNIVGKPMAQLLLNENCTVTIAHSRTRDLPAVVRRADLVIAAAGRAF